MNYIRHNSNNKNTTGKNVNNTRQKKIIKMATSKQFGYDLIVINLVLFSIHFVKIFPLARKISLTLADWGEGPKIYKFAEGGGQTSFVKTQSFLNFF